MKKPLKFFLVAGEPSGDLHGAKLIKAIKRLNPFTSFIGHGGSLMEDEGMTIIEHINKLSIMGFKEVIVHLPRIWKIMINTISFIKKVKPDRIILIDYPGFNLQLAKRIFKLKIPISYFVLPQAWAWKRKRVELVKKYCEQTYSLFPFEKSWYNSKGVNTKFFGHPFMDVEHLDETRAQFFKKHNLNQRDKLIALLPGSRQQEIIKHWNVYIETITLLKKEIPGLQVVIAKSDNTTFPVIDNSFKVEKNAKKAIIASDVAIVASGTATLECAVEETPFVTCYKVSWLTWFLAKYLIKVKYSSIVNLIANKEVVPEFLQSKMKPENITDKLVELIDDKSKLRNQMLDDFVRIKEKLGSPGVYFKVASDILKATDK
tara:strand:- start:1599 stop:2720 length:1122 start_codon:yes stop_codon:yes gene_type:complete